MCSSKRRLQKIRMELLKKMLKDREDNQASIMAKKLDRLWMKKQREKEAKVRQIRTEALKCKPCSILSATSIHLMLFSFA